MPYSIQQSEFKGQPVITVLSGDGARAVVSLFGGQVLSWAPANGLDQLYLSEQAVYDGATPIRGGVPVCFPQFSRLGKLPAHGFARDAVWTLADQRGGDDFAIVTLRLADDERTRTMWPGMFEAELTVAIGGERMDVEFEVENTGHSPFAFTAALHTYLAVREVENIRLEGLNGYEYRDATDDNRIKRDSGDVVVVEDEVNRVYHDVERALLLRDGNRSIGIHAEGFPDVVVWNPWEHRCKEFADLPPNAFRHFICVEAAAARSKIMLDAGESWFGRQTLVKL
ncbi:MAG: D-hexose-6-phosphate mutarotase [Zoogloeaceae bacterium]|nr:D-hexose-6-phosphate mutarotase [Zoogloeaceae bacterium]